MPRFLEAVRTRCAALPAQLPALIAAAEAAAARALAHPGGRVRFPQTAHSVFSDEFIARAGGLANWGAETADGLDPLLYPVLSWAADGAAALPKLMAYQAQGGLPILFAPAASSPDLPSGFHLLDNGVPADDDDRVTFIVNLALGWLWHAEYAAALTRLGVHPRVLRSIFLPGAADFNATLRPDEPLPSCDTPIPAGEGAGHYLARLARLLDDIASETVQGPLQAAAEAIRAHVCAGGRVFSGNFAHVLPGEMSRAVRGPFIPLGIPREADLREQTRPGDLLLFIGYIGLSNPYYDHGAWFRAAGLRLITSFVTDDDPANAAPEALAHIPQSWVRGDAEVPVPFPPGAMCPVSVINQLLLFRLLDDLVAG